MPEVREISASEHPHSGSDHVLIEQTPNGTYRASGSAYHSKASVLFFEPPPFINLDEAIQRSLAWAAENEVPVVYIRDGGL